MGKIFFRIIVLIPLLSGCSNPEEEIIDGTSPQVNQLTPSARGGAPSVWIEEQGSMLFFGGMNPITGDTWKYVTAENEWADVTMEGSNRPSNRCHHTLVTNQSNSIIFLFGGFTFSQRFNDSWIFDKEANIWTELSTSGELPEPRCLHTSSFVEQENQVFVYGGIEGGGVASGDFFEDTYLFDIENSNWDKIETSDQPGKLSGAVSFYSETNHAVYLWGGKRVDIYPNNLWKFDLNKMDWNIVEITGEKPLGREDPIYFWDSNVNQLYVALGSNTTVSGGLVNDAYLLDLEQMSWDKQAGDLPPERWRASVAYDPDAAMGYMFGGWIDFGNLMLDDTWAFDFNKLEWDIID
ncbi:MAG TPA: kelch repeat-containing protein [Cyclobacteriaceae bacterium]